MWRELAVAGTVTAAVALLGLGLQRRPILQHAQYGTAQNLGVGKLLVARPELSDPNFAETVVLLVHYDTEKGTVGLILNRPTKAPLSKVFPEIKGAKDDPVFEGGPVETTTAQALLHGTEKPEGGTRVIGDIYSTGNKDVIEKSISSGARPSEFRLYIGYAGWSTGQLEREVGMGGWSVMRASAALIFDDVPDSLWQRLNHDAQTRIAAARPIVLPLL